MLTRFPQTLQQYFNDLRREKESDGVRRNEREVALLYDRVDYSRPSSARLTTFYKKEVSSSESSGIMNEEINFQQ